MAKNYSDIKTKDIILHNGEPYQVLATHVFRKQQRKPVNQTKLKNLITGKVIEHSFHQSDTIEEAEIEKQQVQYLYTHRNEWWFQDPDDPRDRFQIDADVLGENVRFLKEHAVVDVLKYEERVITVELPIKMTFMVTEAPPNVKGNTSQGGTKPVVIETGATITTPLFVETGDTIEVNTETGEYTGRITK